MGLIYGVVALGVYITFRVIDFPDLTCDGSFVLGAATSSVLLQLNCDPFLSIIAAIFAGAIAGLITGILYVRFRLTNLLSGILTSFMLYSINLRIMGSPNITLFDLESANILWLLVVALILVVITSYLLLTDFGLAIRSIAQNKVLARNSGINVSLVTIIGLAISNAMIALGGSLFAQQQGFADIGSGVGTVIMGLASVMIGERLLPYRSIIVQVISCFIGSIVYRLLLGFALYTDYLGLKTQDLNLVTGILIVSIMYISRRRAC